MPFRAKHQCNEPNCKSLTSERFCAMHKKQVEEAYDAARGSSAERGYTHLWSKVRMMKISADPLCQRCGAAASLVHHKDRNTRNSMEDNLLSMCAPCHDIEHKDERWKGKRR